MSAIANAEADMLRKLNEENATLKEEIKRLKIFIWSHAHDEWVLEEMKRSQKA